MLGEGRPLLRDGQGHGKAFGRCGRRSPDEPWDRKSGTVREVKVADYPGRRRGVPPLILLRMSAMMTCWCSIRLSLVQPRWVALKLGHRAATLDSNPEYTEEARARLGVTNIDQAAGGRLTCQSGFTMSKSGWWRDQIGALRRDARGCRRHYFAAIGRTATVGLEWHVHVLSLEAIKPAQRRPDPWTRALSERGSKILCLDDQPTRDSLPK